MYRNYRDAAVVACAVVALMTRTWDNYSTLCILREPRKRNGVAAWSSWAHLQRSHPVIPAPNIQLQPRERAICEVRIVSGELSKVITLLARYFSSAEFGRAGRNRVLVPRARLMSCGTMQCADTRRRLHTKDTYTYIYIYIYLFADPA